jgi:hypothetical protein
MNLINLELILLIILATVAAIFFIWGTSITSVKHVGIGGIFLSIAVICLILFGIK